MNDTKKYDIIIFDIDGTIFDSIEFNFRCLNYTIEKLGFSERVEEGAVRRNLGKIQKEFFKEILPHTIRDKWETISQENRKNFPEIMGRYGVLFEGVKEVLGELKERGYRLVLYSNCSIQYKTTLLGTFGLENFFDYTECCGENNLSKEEIVLKVMTIFDSRCCIVGDRSDDMEAAHKNKCASIWASYGFDRECNDYDYKIEAFKELLDILP